MKNILYGTPPIRTRNAVLKSISIQKVISIIKTNKQLKNSTLLIRKTKDSLDKKKLKNTLLPYIVPFEYTSPIKLSKYFKQANFLVFEADHVDNMEKRISDILRKRNDILFLYRSVSGDGFKIAFSIDIPLTEKYYTRVWNVLQRRFSIDLQCQLDSSVKDMARAQFLSYDNKCVYNPRSKSLKVSTIVKELEYIDSVAVEKVQKKTFSYNENDIYKAITFIKENGYITTKNYSLWWRLSMCFASLGEEGRKYFLLLSSDNPLYPKDTEKYLNSTFSLFIKKWGDYHDEERLLTMNSFFNIIEKEFNYKSPKTKSQENKNIELILADLFCKKFYNKALFDHSKNVKQKSLGWYLWNGKYFQQSKKGEISDLYLSMLDEEKKKSIERMKVDEIGNPSKKDSELHISLVSKAESRRFRDLTLSWASEREGLGVLPEELDKNPDLFNCQNGIINLRNGLFLKHDPDFKITKFSNVVYREKSKCPLWDDFLSTIFMGDKELITFIQEAVGYSLTGHTSEQCLFFIYGTGANGKSTFLEGLRLILNDYQIYANYETFTNINRDGNSHSEDIVRLRGSRFVVSTEINSQKTLNESIIKQITSGDTITARDLHSSSIEFKPTFKLWIAGNHKPKILNFDHGIKRRIMIVPFEYRFKESETRPQNEIIDEFKKESSGILQWAVEGAQRWYSLKKLTPPPAVFETTKQYFLENNSIEQFVHECCEVSLDTSKIDRCESKLLYTEYLKHSEHSYEERIGRNTFYNRLEELGFKRETTPQQTVVFRGISLHQKKKSVTTLL